MSSSRYLISNGEVFQPHHDTPPVSTFLESNPGAYTTTRTNDNGKCLFLWERHLKRLASSARIIFGSSKWTEPPAVKTLVNYSVKRILPVALREWERVGEAGELAVTALLTRGTKGGDALDVHVHLGAYSPLAFGSRGSGARLAMVGPGRELPQAKYSDWVRLRKPLEKLRPPSVTELLLSNDGDRVLEGSVTNFFVVLQKENNQSMDGDGHKCPFEVQTAPISDGVLPGVLRQLVIEVCLSKGIPVKEVAPAWSKCDCWQEAFITNSLRFLQHVEKIQVPSSWDSLPQKMLNDIAWEEQQFGEGPGPITAMIQKEVMEKAMLERFSY